MTQWPTLEADHGRTESIAIPVNSASSSSATIFAAIFSRISARHPGVELKNAGALFLLALAASVSSACFAIGLFFRCIILLPRPRGRALRIRRQSLLVLPLLHRNQRLDAPLCTVACPGSWSMWIGSESRPTATCLRLRLAATSAQSRSRKTCAQYPILSPLISASHRSHVAVIATTKSPIPHRRESTKPNPCSPFPGNFVGTRPVHQHTSIRFLHVAHVFVFRVPLRCLALCDRAHSADSSRYSGQKPDFDPRLKWHHTRHGNKLNDQALKVQSAPMTRTRCPS